MVVEEVLAKKEASKNTLDNCLTKAAKTKTPKQQQEDDKQHCKQCSYILIMVEMLLAIFSVLLFFSFFFFMWPKVSSVKNQQN